MADLFSPAKFDADDCRIKTAGTGDAIDPKHILVDPDSDNILTNDPATGLKVVAEDFISAEEGNIAKASQADGGVLVKATDMVSDAECNALSVTNDGKLALIPEDLISDVMGGNPLGINPDDCKLYINPCLLPGPQNIVSKDEDNLIVEDPEDCSALLKYRNVVSEDAGNLIQPGTDGKLMVDMQYMVDRGYYGAGLVYVEKQDGSHVLQVAACDGLKFEEGDVTDTYGNTYHAKWLVVNLDESQNILYFKDADGCTECFTDCKQLSLEFSLNANGEKLRILDRNGNVYKQINLSNGLQGDGSGGLTINTLDSIGAGTSDLPVSAKAVKAAIDALQFAPIPHDDTTTQYGAGSGTKYGHVKLSASHTSDLGVGDGTAATPSAVKKAYDDGTRTGNSATQGQVRLSASHTSDLGVSDGTAATPSAVKKAYDDGTRKGTCDTFGQVKLTNSLTSTADCADSVGLSAAAGKQLKDMIDAIIGGTGTLTIGQKAPLYATNFRENEGFVVADVQTPPQNGYYYVKQIYGVPSGVDPEGSGVPEETSLLTRTLAWKRQSANMYYAVCCGNITGVNRDSLSGDGETLLANLQAWVRENGPMPLTTLVKYSCPGYEGTTNVDNRWRFIIQGNGLGHQSAAQYDRASTNATEAQQLESMLDSYAVYLGTTKPTING